MKDVVSKLLMFHLVSMTCFLYKDQLVILTGWHMVIEVSEEIRRITIREFVICSYEQSAGMSDFLCLQNVSRNWKGIVYKEKAVQYNSTNCRVFSFGAWKNLDTGAGVCL